MAEAKLKDPLHAAVLEKAWGGPSGSLNYDGAKARIGEILKELMAGGEQSEAIRSIRELALPFFLHEVGCRVYGMSLQ